MLYSRIISVSLGCLITFLITFLFLAADMEGSSLRSRDKRLSLNLVSTLLEQI